MSTDYSLYRRIEDALPRMDEDGEITGATIGAPEQLVQALEQIKSIRWMEHGEGWITSPDFTLRIALLGTDDQVETLFLSTTEPEFALHAINEICNLLSLEIYDHQAGFFIDRSQIEFYPVEEDTENPDDIDEEEFSETTFRPQVKEYAYHEEPNW